MENPLLILPEVIGYLSGSGLCVLAWLLHSGSQRRNPSLQALQGNLAKVGLVWFSENDSLMELRESTLDHLKTKSLKTRVLTISAMAFMSWLGLFISLLLIYSLRSLHSPAERALFRSELAKKTNLTKEEINIFMQSFRTEFKR